MCQQRKPNKQRATNPCHTCQGRGWIRVPRQHGSIWLKRVTCPACHGAGCANKD